MPQGLGNYNQVTGVSGEKKKSKQMLSDRKTPAGETRNEQDENRVIPLSV